MYVVNFVQLQRFVQNGTVSGPASRGSYETKKKVLEVVQGKGKDQCINSPETWRFSEVT